MRDKLSKIRNGFFGAAIAGAISLGYAGTASAGERVDEDVKDEAPVEQVLPPEEDTKDIAVYPDFRKTSLLGATVYTGIPALGGAIGAFAIDEQNRKLTLDDVMGNIEYGMTHPPVWDKNPWYVNYVGHPIAGSEYYLIARNREYHPLVSFAYSVFFSTAWEYVIESSIGARPSRQDLVITPVVGSVLGELRFRAKKKLMNSESSTLNDVLIVILDPIDAVYRALE